jgi:hypothetical protein
MAQAKVFPAKIGLSQYALYASSIKLLKYSHFSLIAPIHITLLGRSLSSGSIDTQSS